MADTNNLLRNLPRVDELLAHPLLAAGAESAPKVLPREAAREAIEEAREKILSGSLPDAFNLETIVARAAQILRRKMTPNLRRAINAAGIILHTNLGRAPLSSVAQAALAEVAAGYCNVQADLATGARMPRESHVQALLQQITGAEAAVVVNNNAAATVLVLNTLAAGKEVIVSRGEMVEIGGSFRIPDILKLSGCRLVEVGCTNRTHLKDYRAALTPETALLLAVHQSNYRIVGFASQPKLEELAELAREHKIICAHDLGSGALLDLPQFGLPHEPNVPESLAAGAEVVFFSGDKLVGGPQCGLILGKASLLEGMRKNPFYRTFRVDKLTLAALEATLRLFLEPETLPQKHVGFMLLTTPLTEIRRRANRLVRRLRDSAPDLKVTLQQGVSEIGGGSLSGHELPTIVVRIESPLLSPDEIAARLRLGEPPIFVRVQEDAVQLDLRTVFPEEDNLLLAGLKQVLSTPKETS
jgi:L-seryl-tRNA(Ser) seleniumtransferase